MGIYQIKPWFQRQLQPITDAMVKGRVSPDWMTYGAVVVALLIGVALILSAQSQLWLWLICIGVPVRLAMNALDGQVSRALGIADPMGEVKNELGDRTADALIFGAVCFIPAVPLYLSVPTLIIALLIGYVGILSKAVTDVRDYSGIMGKPDRMTALAIGCGLVALTGIWELLWVALGVILLLGSITLIIRLRGIHERS
ncbi:MAG: hypothetical protein AAFR81_29060 [Chloroflexota bacterium]